MTVPLLDLKVQNGALDAELKEAFERVLRSGFYILGPEVEELERELGSYAGARHVIGVSSGTDAILLALMALGIGPGDEVICPSFTFFATAGCIARIGAVPVFAESAKEGFGLDVEDVARRVTPRTKAIIPVHLFGEMTDLGPLMELATAHGLRVVEDAAQALGASYQGRMAGSVGDFGTYSFFPSKNLGCLGDGGALATNDDELAARAKILRVHGMEPKYYHKFIGGNFRIDPLQAALLRVKLPYYSEYSRGRQANAAYYRAELGALEGVGTAGKGSERWTIELPTDPADAFHIWNQFTLRVRSSDGSSARRDALRSFLLERAIGCEIYYPKTLHTQECFSYLGQAKEHLPRAETLSRECLSIPVFPELTEVQRAEVVQAISEFLAG
jgi:dTDP-4-amino-4,6-dideoxygalactose transaminase